MKRLLRFLCLASALPGISLLADGITLTPADGRIDVKIGDELFTSYHFHGVHPVKMVAREQFVADLHINAAIGGSEGDTIGQQRNAGQSRGQTEESQQAFHGVLEC